MGSVGPASTQRVFIRSLAEDYGRWANDEEYRQERVKFAAESDELIRQSRPLDVVL